MIPVPDRAGVVPWPVSGLYLFMRGGRRPDRPRPSPFLLGPVRRVVAP
ncbi:hypothetical protein [Frankia sp. CgS1]|nr:hypothetical protein [Frankia sp. CgIS1]